MPKGRSETSGSSPRLVALWEHPLGDVFGTGDGRRAVMLTMFHRALAGPADSDDAVRTCQQRAKKIASIDDDRIGRVIDVRRAGDGRIVVTTPLYEGLAVGETLVSGPPIPPPRAVAILREVCKALQSMHTADVVHGALTVGSIIVVESDAKTTDATIRLVDTVVGPLFDGDNGGERGVDRQPFTPELAAGKPPTPSTDVYLLGVVAYTMLTGKPPFRGSAAELRKAHAETPPPDALEVPPALSALVSRCLAKRPEDRPSSAEELEAALAAVDLDAKPAAKPAASPTATATSTSSPAAAATPAVTPGPAATKPSSPAEAAKPKPSVVTETTKTTKSSAAAKPWAAGSKSGPHKPLPRFTSPEPKRTDAVATSGKREAGIRVAPLPRLGSPTGPRPKVPTGSQPKVPTGPQPKVGAFAATAEVDPKTAAIEKLKAKTKAGTSSRAKPPPDPVELPEPGPEAETEAKPAPKAETKAKDGDKPKDTGPAPSRESDSEEQTRPATKPAIEPKARPAASAASKKSNRLPIYAAAAAGVAVLGWIALSDGDDPKQDADAAGSQHAQAMSQTRDRGRDQPRQAPSEAEPATDPAPTATEDSGVGEAPPDDPAQPAEAPPDEARDAPIVIEETAEDSPAAEAEGEAEAEAAADETGGAEAVEAEPSGGGGGGSSHGGSSHGESAGVLAAKGKRARVSGNMKEAVVYFKRALSKDSRNLTSLDGLGHIYFNQGDYKKAAHYTKRAVALSPKNVTYRMRLGDAYYKLGKYRDAKEQYEKAAARGHAPAKKRLEMVKKKL